MIARFATYRDLPKILLLLRLAHQESEYSAITPDPERARKALTRMLNPSYKAACVIVLAHEGEINGVLLGMVDWHWWSHHRFATDILTYCKPQARGYGHRLIRFFIRWVKRQPDVAEITLSASTGIVDYQRLERLYARLGFQRTGMTWTKFLLEKEDVRSL
jgi:hypothetical protein